MKGRERSYARDEVIFREGDPSEAVFLIAKGTVELSKAGPDGPVVLARLGPLEMFGEMGILDGSARSATARALEKSQVKSIPREEFVEWLQQDPAAAIRVIAMLVERLRVADAIIAQQRDLQVAGVPIRRRGLLSALRALFRRRPASAAGIDGAAPGPTFAVGIATLNNDIEGAWTRALAGLLEGRPGLAVRTLSASVQLETTGDLAQVNAATVKARQLLSQQDDLDLVVWGDVHEDGYTLWFTPLGAGDEERPGCFGPFFSLELTGEQEPPAGDLFALAVLGAIEPINDAQRTLQRQLLTATQQAMPAFPGEMPVAWNIDQQRTGLLCYAHVLESLATSDAGFDQAIEAYRAAVLRLPREDQGLEQALLRKHLGAALLAAGDRRQDARLLEQAVEEFRAALGCLVRTQFPQEWGGLQNRLGSTLYKLDLLTGQPALLKEAMVAFQSALQAFPRIEAPQRWADVMNNLAQVLQVYGDQVKSPEVLERAVDACRSALEFRVRARTPLAWASSQNTLGTALFLLDKHRQGTEHLDEAATAFTAALEVYRQLGATRLAAVAEKNLAHVDRLRKISRERRVALLDWASPAR